MTSKFFTPCKFLKSKQSMWSPQFYRFASALKRATVDFDEGVSKRIEDKKIKPRKHPGLLVKGPFSLPKPVKETIQRLLDDGPKKQLLTESPKFENYLVSRELPKGEESISKIRSRAQAEVEESMGPVDIENMSKEEMEQFTQSKEMQINKLMKQRVYNWKSLDFTRYLGLLYLVTRSAAEFASVSQVLHEIYSRTSFTPRTFFDFGSGLGSVIWAANEIWGKAISEYYCVDSSSSMIELFEEIIGKYQDEKFTQKIFKRQFLPSSNEVMSDVVVSAFSLSELASSAARVETVRNLWGRTNRFLVLIEHGTLAGVRIIHEARNFIISEVAKGESEKGHIFAPCPHEKSCPRLASKNICYFESHYFCFPQRPEKLKKSFFSYVVFKKGELNTEDKEWPRIVQPVLRRSKHVICRFCTKEGSLNEVIFTAKRQGQVPYRCAKASDWGDLFPCKVSNIKPSMATSDDAELPKEEES